jgi:hypothetical protein
MFVPITDNRTLTFNGHYALCYYPKDNAITVEDDAWAREFKLPGNVLLCEQAHLPVEFDRLQIGSVVRLLHSVLVSANCWDEDVLATTGAEGVVVAIWRDDRRAEIYFPIWDVSGYWDEMLQDLYSIEVISYEPINPSYRKVGSKLPEQFRG